MATTKTTCDAADSQLIIVDIQTKLAEVMPPKVVGRIIDNTGLMLSAAERIGIPVLFSEQYPQGLGPTVAEITEQLPETAKRFEKTSFSCVGADGFEQELTDGKPRQAIITGMEAHVCVLQTAMDLNSRGVQVFVVGDSVCSRRLDNYQNAVERLQRAGVIVTTAESVVFEWLRDARHAHFKEIAAMLQ